MLAIPIYQLYYRRYVYVYAAVVDETTVECSTKWMSGFQRADKKVSCIYAAQKIVHRHTSYR